MLPLLSLSFANGRVTITEIIWCFICLIGLYRTFHLVQRGIFRRNMVEEAIEKNVIPDGPVLILANMYVIIDFLLFLYFVVDLAVGAGALLLPPANRTEPVSPFQVLTVIGVFIGAVIVLSVAETLERTARRIEDKEPALKQVSLQERINECE